MNYNNIICAILQMIEISNVEYAQIVHVRIDCVCQGFNLKLWRQTLCDFIITNCLNVL